MPIFKIAKKTLSPIKEIPFRLERDMQQLTEVNLDVVFGLQLVSSEFSLQSFRLDTLAYDAENKSFVIIEYKRDKNISVVDQGYSYLALMLNNKADFILEYNEKLEKNLKKSDIDWSQSRILFLANSFTVHQRNAINFKDLPIELCEVKQYDNETALYNLLKPTEAKESIKTITKNKTVETVSREIKKYDIEDHFKENWTSRELYEGLSEKVMNLDSRIEANPTKHYISFRISGSNIVEIYVRKSKLLVAVLRVEPKDIKDPSKKLSYWNNSLEHYGKHISKFDVEDIDEIDYAAFIIKQVYDKFLK